MSALFLCARKVFNKPVESRKNAVETFYVFPACF